MSARDADGLWNAGRLFIVAAIVVLVMLLMVYFSAVIAGGIFDAALASAPEEDRRSDPNPVVGEWAVFEGGTGVVEEVYRVNDSTGYAVNLTGADDSFVESRQSVTLADDDTWTVCTWARVDQDAATDNMTALSANGRVLLQYNGSQSNWSAWYYDDGSTDSWRVNVSAPNQPGNYSHVCAWHNGTHLSIYRNNTQGDEVNTTGSNIADADVNSTNWDGRLEEARVFDDALNASDRQELVDDPVGALPGRNRTARLMFDEGRGASTAIYFAGTRADLSNHTWTAGIAGNVLTEGTDYELDLGDKRDPARIRALDGGRLEGAPVVWVFYRFDPATLLGGDIGPMNTALSIMSITGLVAAVVVVLALLGLSLRDVGGLR